MRGQLEGAKSLLDLRNRRIAALERELLETEREIQSLNVALMHGPSVAERTTG